MGFLSNLLGRAKTAEQEIAKRREREPSEQERARATYRELLRAEVEGGSADGDLEHVMSVLGLTAADVERDLAKLRELHGKQTAPKELARLEREADEAQKKWADERRRREEYEALPAKLLSAARAAAKLRDDARYVSAQYVGALATVGKPALPRPDPNVLKIDGQTTFRKPAPEPPAEPAQAPVQQPIVSRPSPHPQRIETLPDGRIIATA